MDAEHGQGQTSTTHPVERTLGHTGGGMSKQLELLSTSALKLAVSTENEVVI